MRSFTLPVKMYIASYKTEGKWPNTKCYLATKHWLVYVLLDRLLQVIAFDLLIVICLIPLSHFFVKNLNRTEWNKILICSFVYPPPHSVSEKYIDRRGRCDGSLS